MNKLTNKWIQSAVQKKGRVKDYIKRKYGSKAFNKDGTLKVSYLQKAVKETKDLSLKRALILAIRFAKNKI